MLGLLFGGAAGCHSDKTAAVPLEVRGSPSRIARTKPAEIATTNNAQPFASKSSAGNDRRIPFAPPTAPIVLPLHKPSSRRVVALTFDACWKTTPSTYDARIITLLRREKVPATLLLGGRWMEHFPKQTTALARDPLFELGNHTYQHPHMTRLSDKDAQNELLKTEAVLYRVTGKTSRFYRPPYGEYDARTVAIAARLGMKTLVWNADSGDPDPKQGQKEIVSDVLRHLRPGGVVLMHMNGRGWHTAAALPLLLVKIRARGFTFVKASEL